MAKNNNLTDFLTAIADKIRSKLYLGSEHKINPQLFENEIEFLCLHYHDIGYQELGTLMSGPDRYYYDKMFYQCVNITSIPELDTSKGLSFNSMFSSCEILETIPELDTSKGLSFNSMFSNCLSLKSIPGLDVSIGTEFNSMFWICKSILEIPNLNTIKGTNFTNMFYKCTSLTTINSINITNATNVSNMFTGCTSLVNISFSGSIKITNLYFGDCISLSHDSLINIINALYDYSSSTSAYTLTLGSTNLSKLTEQEKLIAENKGWTLK